MKKLSLLFGRGRFLSEQWRGNVHRGQAEKEFVAGGILRMTRVTRPCGSSATRRSWGSKAVKRWHFEWRRWCRICFLRCQRRAQCDDGV